MITGGSGRRTGLQGTFPSARDAAPVLQSSGGGEKQEAICESDFSIVSVGESASSQNPGGLVGRYYDPLRLVGGEWKIAHRRFNALTSGVSQAYNPPPWAPTAARSLLTLIRRRTSTPGGATRAAGRGTSHCPVRRRDENED